MPRLAILSLTILAFSLGACAQMESASTPNPAVTTQLQGNAVIAAETNKLNHLARVSIDANELYSDAANEADDKELKAELAALANERADFTTSLQARVAELGGSPAEIGEATGTFHRGFTALRTLVQNDSVAAAGEVYRGESYLIDELTKALEVAMTPESKKLVEAELADVKESRNRVEAMKVRIETRLKVEAETEKLEGAPTR